jgi:hypothetical protein
MQEVSWKKILLGSLVPALTLGCSHTLTLGSKASSEDWQKVNHRLQGKKMEVVLRDGRRIRADSVKVSPETIMWWQTRSRNQQSAQPGEVAVICYRNRLRGALEGAGLGLVAGAAVLAYVGASEAGEVTCSGFICMGGPVAGAIIGALIGAPVGMVGGLTIGMVKGSRICVQFTSDERAPSP